MSWNYTKDPAGVPRDAVRLLLGDVDESDKQLEDEEIAWLLSTAGDNAYDAAARGLDLLASRYQRLADTTWNDLRIAHSQKAEGYRKQAEELRTKYGGGEITVPALVPYVGGLSYSEKESDLGDSDLPPPGIRRGQDDYVSRTSSQNVSREP